MSDLREAIAQEVRVAYYRSLAAHELPCSDKQANVISKLAADAVLDVVTAHMAVTDADAIEMWDALDRAHGVPENDAMKAALESFVARKLKAETT